MLDYIDCNIQAHILYVINATILFYTLCIIILVCTALHKAFVFYEALYHEASFLVLLYLLYILFDDGILLVYLYYIAKYIVFN